MTYAIAIYTCPLMSLECLQKKMSIPKAKKIYFYVDCVF